MLQQFSPHVAETGGAGKNFGRRVLFCSLVAATIAGLVWLAATALSAGGFGLLDAVLLACFAVTLPWIVIGFWNAMIGFLIMRFADDPVAAVCPVAARVVGNEPITAATAILLCIRNESPERMVRNLDPLIAGLVSSGTAERFHVYVLSDTSRPEVAAAEEAQCKMLAEKWRDAVGITYRRRSDNEGFKAGNIRDFCERWGAQHELAVVLDADSFMTAESVLRLVRFMQADPKLGILQGLVVGLPSTSAFARLFQFGMRLGMWSYTLGGAWWQGDCGPYWGHNAVIRLSPFIAHCHLPALPGTGVLGGHVLSHDQVEAVLMRRAGYEVRVLPDDELGWEENPPTLPEFIRRDLRWCQGNMQYWRFLRLPGLKPVSRYQLAFAILMFLGSPAWIGLLVLGTLGAALAKGPGSFIHPGAGKLLFAVVLMMWFAPKIASAADVFLRPKALAAFGGTHRFLASVAIEAVFFTLLCPIMWFGHTVFLFGLPFGRAIGWIGQTRDDHTVPLALAVRDLWAHTVLGLTTLGALALTHRAAIPYALCLAGGPALAIPLAVITAMPRAGRALVTVGLGRLPEETLPPPALRELALPAVEGTLAPLRPRPA